MHQQRSEMGQGMTEYALLLGLVALVGALALTPLGPMIYEALTGLFAGESGGAEVDSAGFVVSVLQDDGEAVANVRVFAYDADGRYVDAFADTDATGMAQFAALADGGYQFLARYQENGYWSTAVTIPRVSSTTIAVPVQAFKVQVVDLTGANIAGVPVYAYSGDETFLDLEAETADDGAAFQLTEGDVKFRADYQNQEHWSSRVDVADGSTTITINNCPTGQFLAEYFANNQLKGEPTFTRCEQEINNFWGTGGPGNGVGNNRFSVRWTGIHEFAEGTETFTVSTDDGSRVFIDGKQQFSSWKPQGTTRYNFDVALTAGLHELKYEFFENYGHATAVLKWRTPAEELDLDKADNCSEGQFFAEYYDNRYFYGEPVHTQCETSINNNWGRGGPGNGVPNDNFAVRWTGAFTFAAGVYQFAVTTDDGSRVYFDRTAVFDSWKYQSPTNYTFDVNASAGAHVITYEFFEGGGGAYAALSWSGP